MKKTFFYENHFISSFRFTLILLSLVSIITPLYLVYAQYGEHCNYRAPGWACSWGYCMCLFPGYNQCTHGSECKIYGCLGNNCGCGYECEYHDVHPCGGPPLNSCSCTGKCQCSGKCPNNDYCPIGTCSCASPCSCGTVCSTKYNCGTPISCTCDIQCGCGDKCYGYICWPKACTCGGVSCDIMCGESICKNLSNCPLGECKAK